MFSKYARRLAVWEACGAHSTVTRSFAISALCLYHSQETESITDYLHSCVVCRLLICAHCLVTLWFPTVM